MIACAGCGYAAAPNAQCGYCGHVNGTIQAAVSPPPPATAVAPYGPPYGATQGTPRPMYQPAPAYYGQQGVGYVVAPPKSRIAYILLGLFLGNLGIHNFYAGRTSTAVTQLLLFVFLFWTIVVPIGIAIWVIVEICTVKTDGNGQYMM